MRPLSLFFLVLGLVLIMAAPMFAQTVSLGCLAWGCEFFLGSFFLEAVTVWQYSSSLHPA